VRILKEVLAISEKAKTEIESVIVDVRDLRSAIREEGSKLKSISEMLTRFSPKKRKARPKASDDEPLTN